MPDDMPIDAFQPTILRSLTQYKRIAETSTDKIQQLTMRSNEQRLIIQRGPSMVIELDPMATCWICKGPIYRMRFLVFPCLHTVHVKCLLSNMYLYFETTQQLQLVALSAKAAKDPNKTAGLADLLCASCPICGELSLAVLQKSFVRKHDVTEKARWALPPVERMIPKAAPPPKAFPKRRP
jgi:hypothetical protein